MCGFANSTLDLMIYRFITGVGLGRSHAFISTIVSEYMPVKRKISLQVLLAADLCSVFRAVGCPVSLSIRKLWLGQSDYYWRKYS